MCMGWREGECRTDSEVDVCMRVFKVSKSMHTIIERREVGETALSIRAGMNCGSVVSGVIGRSKFCFDIWGVWPCVRCLHLFLWWAGGPFVGDTAFNLGCVEAAPWQ